MTPTTRTLIVPASQHATEPLSGKGYGCTTGDPAFRGNALWALIDPMGAFVARAAAFSRSDGAWTFYVPADPLRKGTYHLTARCTNDKDFSFDYPTATIEFVP